MQDAESLMIASIGSMIWVLRLQRNEHRRGCRELLRAYSCPSFDYSALSMRRGNSPRVSIGSIPPSTRPRRIKPLE